VINITGHAQAKPPLAYIHMYMWTHTIFNGPITRCTIVIVIDPNLVIKIVTVHN